MINYFIADPTDKARAGTPWERCVNCHAAYNDHTNGSCPKDLIEEVGPVTNRETALNMSFSVRKQSDALFIGNGDQRVQLYDAPESLLRKLCQWNDPNGDYDNMTACELCDVIEGWYEADPTAWA